MTDTPTLAGLASELADVIARLNRLETAHPAWCVPLTEDEESTDTAESGPVRPCEPRSAQTASGASPDSRGAQKGTEADVTDEPPVGTLLVDSEGDVWRRKENGWHLWLNADRRWRAFRDSWKAVRTYAPLSIATTDDLRRVGLIDEQGRPSTDLLLGALSPETKQAITEEETAEPTPDPIEAAHRAAKDAGMVAVKIPLDWTATKWRSKADDGIAWSRWLYDVGHAIAEGIEAQQALTERNRA